jgi:hypothetical protein
MSKFDAQYAQFQLTPEKCENLKYLADPSQYLLRAADRVIVETVVVEHGERRVIKKEEKGAELV